MAKEKISFKGYHIPGLQSGEFSLKPNVVIKADKIAATKFNSPALNLFVSGPRFIFTPKEIYSVFPPRDSLGEHTNVLPHIELEPSTLPWLRKTIGATEKAKGQNFPWLALILLQEDEWTDKDKVSIESKPWKDYRDTVNKGQNPEKIGHEITDNPPEKGKEYPPLKVLNIEPGFLKKIMPTGKELKWLSHVRVGHKRSEKNEEEEIERAILVCNRMPKAAARAAVHLVSLEGRLKHTGEFDYSLGLENDKVPLLSIHSWEFACPDDEQFKVSAKALQDLDWIKKVKVKFHSNELNKKHNKKDFLNALKTTFDKNPLTEKQTNELLKVSKNGTGDEYKLNDEVFANWDWVEKLKEAYPDELAQDILYRGKADFFNEVEAKLQKQQKAFKVTDEIKQQLQIACHIQTETFKGLMDALDRKWIHLSKPKGADTGSNKFFEIGSVPLAHGLRQGDKTASWYRGPLIADKNVSEALESELLAALPVRSADHLLMFNKKTKMLDISYASAWEIGRLISMSEPTVSQQIAQWKTSHAREVALVEQNLVFSHVPFTDAEFAHKESAQLEEKLQKYFTDLSRVCQ